MITLTYCVFLFPILLFSLPPLGTRILFSPQDLGLAYNQEEKREKKRKSHSLIFVSSSIRLTSRLGMSEGMSKLSESLTYLKCLPNILFEKFLNYIICIRAPAFNYRLGCILAMLSDPRTVGVRGLGAQCVELKLRWRFCVHTSTRPESYF